MPGEQKTHEPQLHDQSPSRQSSSKPESDHLSQQQQQRNRGRRTGSSGNTRKSTYQFDDQREHDLCQLVTHTVPVGFPVHNRTELVTMPPVEVARDDHRILFCDRGHTGPHIWPNGDEVTAADRGDSHPRS